MTNGEGSESDSKLIPWEILPLEKASQAVSAGFIHFLNNSLTRLSLRGVPREIFLPMTVSSEEIGEVRASSREGAIRDTAQSIVLKIRNKIRQGFLLPKDAGNPEKNWFAKVKNNYISRMGEKDKAGASDALASIRNQWENLLDLANPEKLITLPLVPGDGVLPIHFNMRAPRPSKQ